MTTYGLRSNCPKPGSPAARQIELLIARDFCHYCRYEFIGDVQPRSRDHIIPRSLGGRNSLTNLVLACLPCNSGRGVRPYTEFKAAMDAWLANGGKDPRSKGEKRRAHAALPGAALGLVRTPSGWRVASKPVEWIGKQRRLSGNSPKPGTKRAGQIAELIERDGNWCHYCERPFNKGLWPSRDHLLPRSLGGRSTLSNFVVACTDCNTARGVTPYAEFKAAMLAWLNGDGPDPRRHLRGYRPPVPPRVARRTARKYVLDRTPCANCYNLRTVDDPFATCAWHRGA